MATSPFPFPVAVKHHRHRRPPPPKHNFSVTKTYHLLSFSPPSSFEINLYRSFPFFKHNSRFDRCFATGSPSEPPSEPPSKTPLPPSSGVSPKDTMQIFFAVLFWMSLFFWSCAGDRGNGGRPDKGSRFRK